MNLERLLVFEIIRMTFSNVQITFRCYCNMNGNSGVVLTGKDWETL